MEITFLETSDVHGYLYPTDFISSQTRPIGLANLTSQIQSIRKQAKGPVITIENGDFIQGSPLAYYVEKHTASAALFATCSNHVRYDAHILGNHEFNYGKDYLKRTITEYKAPVLAANIVNEQREPYFGTPYIILEREGIRIAILGLTTQYIPHWEQPKTLEGIHFESAVSCAKRYIPLLKKQADIIVVCYHGGFERDLETGEPTEVLTGENEGYALLHEVDGIDACFTGHQHRQIATKVNGIPVVQPGYRGSHLGEIKLEVERIDGAIRIQHSEARLYSMEDVSPDQEMIKLAAPMYQALDTWLDQEVGHVTGDMLIHDANQARIVEHPYVEFINRVQMEATDSPISCTALFNNEGKGFGTTITVRDILTNYPYPNTLAVLEITGADLKSALEKSAGYLAEIDGQIVFNPEFIFPKPQYYNYDMYEGIDYTIDVRRPIGQRVTTLLFEGKPVELTQNLTLVTNQYRAVGGGDYRMFSADKIIREVQVDMTELILDYLYRHPKLSATTNQNFTII